MIADATAAVAGVASQASPTNVKAVVTTTKIFFMTPPLCESSVIAKLACGLHVIAAAIRPPWDEQALIGRPHLSCG
jgi:hypothetical protein